MGEGEVCKKCFRLYLGYVCVFICQKIVANTTVVMHGHYCIFNLIPFSDSSSTHF